MPAKLHQQIGDQIIYKQKNCLRWTKNGQMHRENGPAVEYDNGDCEWFINGVRHREDGPAIIRTTENKKSDLNDFHYHASVGFFPARSTKFVKSEEWWVNGKLHRENEPAIIKSYTFPKLVYLNTEEYNTSCVDYLLTIKQWYSNNKLHRENAPAIETYLMDQINSQVWMKNGKKHREDGPAFKTFKDETGILNIQKMVEQWWLNGKLHRDNGPAIIGDNSEIWYKHGNLHRHNGPACVRLDMKTLSIKKEWYLFGTPVTAQDVFDQLKPEEALDILWNINEWMAG